MPKKYLSFAIALIVFSCRASHSQSLQRTTTSAVAVDFQAPDGDPYANTVRADARTSIEEIQNFFHAPFPDTVHFKIVANRARFDDAVAKYGLSPSQCWMVGFGTADLVVVLSLQAWPKQACEHAPKDLEATRMLVKHELIHVYHGQFNPTRDFTGMDDLDWFIEGLAVYGSGQLTKERLGQVQTAVDQGQLPTELAKIWTGPQKYGFARSLVQYVDQKWGRVMTVRLLKTRSSAEVPSLLGTDEKTLLGGWRTSLTEK